MEVDNAVVLRIETAGCPYEHIRADFITEDRYTHKTNVYPSSLAS